MNKSALAGVALIIKNDQKILLGLRRRSHGAGTWAVPGGHVDFAESPESTAIREAYEECGIKIKKPKFITITNDVFELEKKHYITLWYLAETSENPKSTAPEEIDDWQWFDVNQLPQPLFLPLVNLIDSGYNL